MADINEYERQRSCNVEYNRQVLNSLLQPLQPLLPSSQQNQLEVKPKTVKTRKGRPKRVINETDYEKQTILSKPDRRTSARLAKKVKVNSYLLILTLSIM